MSHNYTPSPVALPATIPLPDDGDLASAASVNNPFGNLADAAQLTKQQLNGVSNGVVLTNPTLRGINTIQNNGPDRQTNFVSQDVTLDDDSTLTLTGGGAGVTVDCNRNLNVLSTALQVTSGLVTIDTSCTISNATLTCADTTAVVFHNGFVCSLGGSCDFGPAVSDVTMRCPLIFSSSGKLSGTIPLDGTITPTGGGTLRKLPVDGADGDHTYSISDGDVFFAPTQSANHTWTFSNASEGVQIQVTCLLNGSPQITNPARVLTLHNQDGTTIGIIGGGSGTIESMTLVFRASTSKWQQVHRSLSP